MFLIFFFFEISIILDPTNFMNFLSRHPFAFAPFPSQFYVSVRRNIPYFDYNTFIKKVLIFYFF